MWFSVTGLPVSSPWKIGLLAMGDGGDARDRLLRGPRVVTGIFAERAFQHSLVEVDLELDHDFGRGRHRHVAGLAGGQLDRRAAQAAGDAPVVGVVRYLHLAGIGEDRIDADHQRRFRHRAHALVLGQRLAEAVERLRRERHRVLAENEKPVMADVGRAGLRIMRHHDARRDVGAAVLRAVGRDRPAPQIDVVAADDLVVARRRAGRHRGRDRVVEPVQNLVEDGVLVGLESQQCLAAGGIEPGNQRIIGPILVEHDGGALPDIALLHRLADVVQRDRPVDVDELAVLAQHIEELAKVVIRHRGLRTVA